MKPAKKPLRYAKRISRTIKAGLFAFLIVGGTHLEAAPDKGSIAITSDPAGAQIFFNGIDKGKTPKTLSGLSSGEYRIELRKDGYDRAYRTVALLEGQEVEARLQLEKTTGLLLVSSTPGGANVVVQGEVVGTTPALITDLPLGDYQVEIQAIGLPPRLVNVELVDRKPVQAHVRQAPRVAVNSYPPGAEIAVDNELVGTAPLVLANIPEGSHQITAKLVEYDTQKKTIQLTPGLNVAIEFNMEKNSGLLVLDTEPALIHVYIDGVHVATTQPKGGVDASSQPLRMALKAGVDHKIQLVRDGFTSTFMTVRTGIDQAVTRHEVLQRIFVYDTRIITDSEIIKCRIEYKLPNGNIYYERYPGVFNTAKAADIRDVQPISLDDASNREARRLIEKSKQIAPE
ncbi:MAG: PEGA domain-containing protein [Verrucomicrobia bacterium]|nr:PEGA domain-containing protein [Verrucomicrobiota bacterium]